MYWDIPLSAQEEKKVVGMEVHLNGVIKGAREYLLWSLHWICSEDSQFD